jgi:serine/threonine-protein kinase
VSDALVSDTLERLRLTLAGRYAVEREIGRGGMATVFLAQDVRHERRVAIKVLKPELSASIGADRFLREIKLAAQLQHPNILGLFDSGEAEGLLYYVMPFVEGESLRDTLDREHHLSIEDAIQIIREAADGLGYAHAHGIVHRDIKPENILLTGGHALVADFGIARAFSEAGGQKLTETGMAVGTPYYMSPEQAMGGTLDARSDVYSLGCVLYELLSGAPPFTGPTAIAILARHSLEAIPSIQIVRPAVPDEVEAIIMRALAKTPADRFKTMQEFTEALREADYSRVTRRTTARTIATAELPRTQRVEARRRPIWVYAAGGVLLLLVAALAWQTWRSRGPVPAIAAAGGLDPHRVGVLYFQNLSEKDSLGYLADGLTEGLIRELTLVPTLGVISRNGVAAYRGEGVPRDSIARALKVGTLVLGSLEKEGGRLRVTVRLIDGASGADFQRASFEHPANDVLALRDTLTQKVADLIRQRLGEEIKLRELRQGTANPQAWALLQHAEQARKQAEAQVERHDTGSVLAGSFDQADSLFAQAQATDPKWADPVVARGFLAYRRSRLAGFDPLAAKPWIERGERFAGDALALEPQDPDALELRGTLRYWSWLLRLQTDPTAAKTLLKNAQNDLETAVKIRPSQAGAWAALSHLYNQSQTAGETDAKLAAQRAYEQDAYLTNADKILWRLFLSSYDLSQFVDAIHWCEEGARRFPGDYKFLKCPLFLMTSKAREPDVALAWRLVDSVAKAAPAPRRDFEKLEGQMLVAIVLARAGLMDSARHVAQRSRGGSEIDQTRDLMLDEAYVHLLRGDRDEALKALKVYLAANPDRRAGMAEDPGWWFRGLQDDPRFQQMVRGK